MLVFGTDALDDAGNVLIPSIACRIAILGINNPVEAEKKEEKTFSHTNNNLIEGQNEIEQKISKQQESLSEANELVKKSLLSLAQLNGTSENGSKEIAELKEEIKTLQESSPYLKPFSLLFPKIIENLNNHSELIKLLKQVELSSSHNGEIQQAEKIVEKLESKNVDCREIRKWLSSCSVPLYSIEKQKNVTQI